MEYDPPRGDAKTMIGFQLDIRTLRQEIGDTQDRLVACEVRQKSAEERTLSMLDAIMGGLTNPGD